MMFTDDIVPCDDIEADMTEYLETWRSALKDRGMRISRPNTQFIGFKFGQDNAQGRGMTIDISQSECSMEKLEEMQRSVV